MQDYSGYSGYGQPPSGDFGPTAPLPPMPPRPPRRHIGLLSYLGVALAAGALGAGTVVALYHPAASSPVSAQPSSSALAPAPLPSTAIPAPSSGGTGTAGGSLAKVEQGIVIINTTLQYSSERAAGTGMVINAGDGLVLTNNHVIENATKITATAATGQKFPAKVVGYDVTGDIALIRLQNPSGLHAVPIGDSGKVKPGAPVTALGNAGGRSTIVAAAGHITGVNRTITASDQGGTVKSETLHGMLQTDAAVVSGDSGGPLVNSAGRVIGMDTAGNDVSFPDQQQPAAGFAIPIITALSVAQQIAEGHASATIAIGYPPFIGIYVGQGTSSDPRQQAAAQQQQQNNGFGGFGGGFGNGSGGSQSCYTSDANLPVPSTIAPVSSGTLVIGTICGSPAATAGVTAGSVVTGVNGQAIGEPQSLHSKLAQFRPGATVSLTWVTPSGQRETGNVTLTAGPPL